LQSLHQWVKSVPCNTFGVYPSTAGNTICKSQYLLIRVFDFVFGLHFTPSGPNCSR
jgi:hypothetical protein